MKIIIAILLLLLLFLVGAGHAAILTVGDGKTHATITLALAAASNNDTIEVYSDGGSNVYVEDVDFGALDNIILKGMIADYGVAIQPAGDADYFIDLGSDADGNTIQDFELKFIEDAEEYIYVSGHNHTIKQCKFTGSNVARTDCLILVYGNNFSLLHCIVDNVDSYSLISAASNSSGAVIKYNDISGPNTYTIGPGEGGSNITISCNYIHATGDEASSWKAIRMRSITNYIISYNLIILTGLSAWQNAINDRESDNINSGPGTVEHNTVIAPKVNGTAYESSGFGTEGDAGLSGQIVVRDNIFQGGEYSGAAWGGSASVDINFKYNYCYDPNDAPDYYDSEADSWWTFSNNTETTATPPGFTQDGVVWQTDGTDAGTVSDYYALVHSAPAATAGENYTYCGAFDVKSTSVGCGIIRGMLQ